MYDFGISRKNLKKALVYPDVKFDKRKIAEFISDFLVEIVGVEPATS